MKICVENAKANYYNSKITNCHGNQQALFSIINALLGKDDKSHVQIPLSTEDVSVAEKFSDYFVQRLLRLEMFFHNFLPLLQRLPVPLLPHL